VGRKLLLYISYRGDEFCGYQAQKNGPSVQAALNRAAEDLFGHPCDITGCSRTDSGVHARMFCATVKRQGCDTLDTGIPVHRIPPALCVRLPDSLSVWEALWVPDSFHPRYDVSSKEYIYRFLLSPYRDPFEAGRSWNLPCKGHPDLLSDMQKAAGAMVGCRDFSACMATGSEVLNRVRHVTEAQVTQEGRILTFRVRADGFLYHMVRIMAGTLCDVAAGRIDPSTLPARLDSLDRRQMGQTAPACGLYLNRVFYDDPLRPGYHGGALHGKPEA
jgi:tRNA pseudouridine38-40 synthase